MLGIFMYCWQSGQLGCAAASSAKRGICSEEVAIQDACVYDESNCARERASETTLCIPLMYFMTQSNSDIMCTQPI